MDGRHKQKTFTQIMLMCLGFFGIQFGYVWNNLGKQSTFITAYLLKSK